MASKALQERVWSVIEELIPGDAHKRVTRAVTEANQTVREHIRTETGLRLFDGKQRTYVPVRVVEGFPAPLARLIVKHEDPVLWRLLLIQPKMPSVIEGLDMLIKNWLQVMTVEPLRQMGLNQSEPLEFTREVAVQLQRLKVAKEVWKGIGAIDKDILGIYRQDLGCGPRIEVYWMPVALISGMLGEAMEDLAVVTLAHELAHAYTHLGCDIDGRTWNDDGFWRSGIPVIEGLAQFYTQTVAKKLVDRRPGVQTAFEALLKRQHCAYTCFTGWLSDDENRAEGIRVAMLAARNQECVNYEHWLDLLRHTKAYLKSDRKQQTLFS